MFTTRHLLSNVVLTLAVFWLVPVNIARATTCHDCINLNTAQSPADVTQPKQTSDTISEDSSSPAFATARFRIMFNESFILDICQRPDLGAMFRKIIKDRVLACPFEGDVIKQFVEFSEITEKAMDAKIKAHSHNNTDARHSLSSGRYSCQEVLHNKNPTIREDSARKFKLYKNYKMGKATLEEVMPHKACANASAGFPNPTDSTSTLVDQK